MTDLRQAAQAALDALDNAIDHLPKPYSTGCSNAATDLRAALAAQPQQAAADHPAYQLGFADGAAQYAHKTRGQIREQAAQPVAQGPMPGGIRLTVVERCELIDWRDKCVDDAVSRTLAAAQPQQATAGPVLTDDEIVSALKSCEQEDHAQAGWVWRQRVKWCRAIEAAVIAKLGGAA